MKWIFAFSFFITASTAFANHSLKCGDQCCEGFAKVIGALDTADNQRSLDQKMGLEMLGFVCPRFAAGEQSLEACATELHDFYANECAH